LSIINRILSEWPSGTLVTNEWLEKKGVSRQLAASYVKSGWFEKLGTGVYKRPGEEVTWAGVLYTLQTMSGLPVHAGGKTALELQGLGHYIRMDTRQSRVLWKEPDVWLPAWFKNSDLNVSFQVRSARLFDDDTDLGLTKKSVERLELRLSSPERAVLEYVHDIPRLESFDEAHYVMEGLATLRPPVLQSLLENCQSVKVKRLFLQMASTYKHAWFKRLDESSIDLGSGKREIIKGGKLDKKYQIVVPEIKREER
jgi:hypothetical protein